MTPALSIAIILFIVALSLTIWANSMLKRAQDILKDSKAISQSATEEIEHMQRKCSDQWEQILSKTERILQRDKEILQLKKTVPSFSEPRSFDIGKSLEGYYVIATYKSQNLPSEIKLPVKLFPYDGDADFALREAQELLDHLKEK